MVTVSSRVLLPLLAPILVPTACPTLASNTVPPVRLRPVTTNHANEEFGMIYPEPKITLPMGGERI